MGTAASGVRRRERFGIAAAAGVAAAVTIAVGPEPTGTTIVDIVYGIGFALALTVGAATSPPLLRRWLAGVITVGLCVAALDSGSVAPLPWALLAGVAFVIAFVWDSPLVGAVVGAAVITSLWHLAPLGATGVPSLLTAVAAVPILVHLWRYGRRRYPMLCRFGMQLVAVAALWMVVAAVSTLYSSRSAIESASAAGRNANQLFAEGRLSGALAEGAVAARQTSVVEYRLDRWWNRGLFAVPVVAQNLRAGLEMARAGRSLLEVAEPIIDEGISIRHVDGRLDTQGLQALGGWIVPLTRQAGYVGWRAHTVESVWLVGSLGSTVRSTERVGAVLSGRGEELAELFSVAPRLLGAEGPKRYLVLFMTPVEARELEGLVGNWALLIADDGLIRVERVGRVKDLNSRATGEGFADPDSYPKRYLHYRVAEYFQNVTASPDFPTVARAASEVFPQMGGVPIDGVAAVDPFAIGSLVDATGPITIPGFEDPFDGERVTQFLLFDQYSQLPDLEQRELVLDTLTRNAFSAVLDDGVGRLDRLLEAFDRPIAQHRLLFTTFDEPINEALDVMGVRGEFPPPSDDFDTVSVRHDSSVARKIDGYITREMSYSIVSDPDRGESDIELAVTVTNDTPYGLLPYVAGTDEDYEFPDGSPLAPNDHLLRLSVYTSAELESVDVEDQTPSPQVADHYTENEYGYYRHFVWIVVPQGASTRVTFNLKAPYAPDADEPVAIRVIPQPLVNDDIWTFAARQAAAMPDQTRRFGPSPIVVPAEIVLPAPG